MKKIKFRNNITFNNFSNNLELFDNLKSSMVKFINKGTCILPGGKTPLYLYKLLSLSKRIKNNRRVFLSDDRLVNNENDLSNFKMILNNLKIDVNSRFLFSYYDLINNYGLIKAQKYISQNFLDNEIECSLLGIGEDAHTASLFPENNQILENKKIGIIVKNKSENFKRFSLSFDTLLSSKKIIFLATGKRKNQILKSIFSEKHDPLKYPVQQIFNNHPDVTVYCDEDAFKNILG